MVDDCIAIASKKEDCKWMLDPDWKGLDGVGMGLSGCEDEMANETFVNLLLTRYPQLATSGHAVSDTIGSIYTACPDGKLVNILEFSLIYVVFYSFFLNLT